MHGAGRLAAAVLLLLLLPPPCSSDCGGDQPGCCKFCVPTKPLEGPAFTTNDLGEFPAARLNVYVPPAYQPEANLCASEHGFTFGAERIHLEPSSILYPVRDWLWKHDEYISVDMQRQFMLCGATRVDSPAKADVCWPNCAGGRPRPFGGRYSGQMLTLQMAPGKEVGHCSHVTMHMEAAKPYNTDRCHMVIPYFHGIYTPATWKTAPWDLQAARDKLLYFFGGMGRGAGGMRYDGMKGLQALSELIGAQRNATAAPRCRGKHCKYIAGFVYAAAGKPMRQHSTFFEWTELHDLQRQFNLTGKFLKRGACKGKPNCVDDDAFRALPSFYAHGWEMYATSSFCWQPAGDTPTRRAFYDGWMFGCIPVLQNSSYHAYSRVFAGLLYQDVPLDKIAVVIDDDDQFYNASRIFHELSSITNAEVKACRSTDKCHSTTAPPITHLPAQRGA